MLKIKTNFTNMSALMCTSIFSFVGCQEFSHEATESRMLVILLISYVFLQVLHRRNWQKACLQDIVPYHLLVNPLCTQRSIHSLMNCTEGGFQHF